MPSRPRTIERPRITERGIGGLFAMGHALNRAGILVRGIHEHHAGYLAWVRVVIQADDVPAKRMAHEHKRRPESCVLHEAMQIPRGRIAPRRVRPGITPTDVRAVVPARARECGDATLGRRPDVARRRAAAHEDDCWTAFSSAVDIQRSSTDVDGAPNLLQHAAIAPRADVFVDGAPQAARAQHRIATSLAPTRTSRVRGCPRASLQAWAFFPEDRRRSQVPTSAAGPTSKDHPGPTGARHRHRRQNRSHAPHATTMYPARSVRSDPERTVRKRSAACECRSRGWGESWGEDSRC